MKKKKKKKQERKKEKKYGQNTNQSERPLGMM